MENIRVRVVRFGDRDALQMQYVDPATGKKKTRSTGTTIRRDAERIAAKWEAELREGRYKSPLKITWEEFRDRYEAEVLPGLAVNTRIKVDGVFNLLESIVNPQRLRDVTADRLSFFAAELRKDRIEERPATSGDSPPATEGTHRKPPRVRRGRSETTVKAYLAHLKAALRWAAQVGMMHASPAFPTIKRAKGANLMKGRPITAEEFERMLGKVAAVVGDEAALAWKFYLNGLWWSGLRLRESLQLSWDDETRLTVDLAGDAPLFRIPGELQKSNKDQLLPMAPEFAAFLQAVPREQRSGFVFRLQPPAGEGKVTANTVGRTVSVIGRKATVLVNVDQRTGKAKSASAHDLRRAFGERWSVRVMPQVLKELMRHESIETTLRYYVGRNAQNTSRVILDAYRKSLNGNTSGNTASVERKESTEAVDSNSMNSTRY